jgi:hypothetical protein
MTKNLDEVRDDPPGGASYRAFLLRCWQEAGPDPSGEPNWRFALVKLGSEQSRQGFSCLEDMSAYLKAELQTVSKS